MYIVLLTNTNINIISCDTMRSITEDYLYRWGSGEINNDVKFIEFESHSQLSPQGRMHIINNTKIYRTFLPLVDVFAIMNYTQDSFSDGGVYVDVDKFFEQMITHINHGAQIIDIGVESTNPQSQPMHSSEEIKRLSLIIDTAIEIKTKYKVLLSIDTYHNETVKWLLDKDIDIINDVSGNVDNDLIKILTNSARKYVAMHSMTIPANPQVHIPLETNPVEFILSWMQNKLLQFDKHNIPLENIVLDVGIGFGVNAPQSWYILKNLDKFKILPCEILVGHSRKSFINHVHEIQPIHRDMATSIIGTNIPNNVDYLRLHNVEMFYVTYRINNELCDY